MTRPASRLAALAAVTAAGLLLLPAAAQPLPPTSPLRYVPADAAVFVHADAAALWAGPVGKAVRDLDPKEFPVAAKSTELFGVAPDEVKTVTAFWPRLAGPADTTRAGVVLTFRAPYDAAALKAGVEKLLPERGAVRVVAKDATTAVILFGLGAEYAAPRPLAETGPLTPYLREAAGPHLVSAGVTLANLPDEIRGDVPPDVQPFRPLFHADAAAAFLDLGAELALDLRVKAPTAVKAGEAEKALGVLATTAGQALASIPAKELADPAIRNTAVVVAALKNGLTGAKFSTTGTEARARVAIPGILPLAAAGAEAVAKVRGAAARAKSFNNLRQLALAVHNYESAYGKIPPAARIGKDARPLLSWRVLILPYVEQEALYRRFNLDEPWDGPTNKKLLDPMPAVFALPTPSKAKATETHYQAFVGKGAAFDLFFGPSLVQFADGTSNTILLATAATPVPWTKPDDIRFDPDADMTKALGFFPDVAHAAFADGSVRALRRTIPAKGLAALITRNGGEVIGDDDF